MKKSILIISAIALVLGCQKAEIGGNPENMGFEASVASIPEKEMLKSVGIPTQAEGIDVVLRWSEADTDMENTKGTQLSADGNVHPLSEYVQTFCLTAYNSDKSEFIPSNTVVEYKGGKWSMSNQYVWVNSGHKYMTAYANLPAGCTATTAFTDSDSPVQTYAHTVPADAKDQIDILMGYFEGRGRLSSDGSTRLASLKFNHPLTAVVFQADRMGGIKSVNNISLEGVYGSGTVTQTNTFDGSSDPVFNFEWAAGEKITSAQTVASGTLTSGSVIGEPFLLIPQNLGTDNVKLTLNVTLNDDTAKSITAYLNQFSWEWGKTNIYTLSFGDLPIDGDLEGLVPAHAKSFTINAQGDKVYFSKGNLQFRAKTSEGDQWPAAKSGAAVPLRETLDKHWRFAEHQWDYVGNSTTPGTVWEEINEISTRCFNSSRKSDYQGWIDAFCWGQAGFYIRNVNYPDPWYDYNNASYASYFGPNGNVDLSIDNKSDWGWLMSEETNVSWRTLTIDEWNYILAGIANTTYNTSSACRVNANEKRGLAQLTQTLTDGTTATINGLVILPDDFTFPGGLESKWAPSSNTYEGNKFSIDEWTAMEDSGAVFLPAVSSGGAYSTSDIYYWTASSYSTSQGKLIRLYKNAVPVTFSYANRNIRYPVRLVTPAN